MKQLLGNTDSLQLFPLAYPWAWDMYLENMDNHWTPREIPVASDVALWRSDRLSEVKARLDRGFYNSVEVRTRVAERLDLVARNLEVL